MTADPTVPSTTPSSEGTPEAPSADATMSVLAATSYGTAEVLEWSEKPVPVPAADEVQVAVAASSLNALDWHFLTGTPYFLRLMAGLRRPKRTIPGADMAGTVVAVGAEVTHLSVGDRVYGETDGGGCAPYLATTASTVVPIADHVSFEAAAATPVAGLTAIQGLQTHAAVQPGERVLVNGA
ncbi:MAG: alcohol dehydrogenase catalytic domain-containing protein, partial [Actinomycetota bacterium]